MQVDYRFPWLCLDTGRVMRMLSWAPHNPGFVAARHIIWREVRNADLPPERDAIAWLGDEMQAIGRTDAVGMLTSRKIATWRQAHRISEGARLDCVATVGLSNAERAGAPAPRAQDLAASWGTINIALVLDTGLSDAGFIEALGIAVSARTAAVIDSGAMTPTGPATGTGTDCIVIAAHAGQTRWCGLHTALGQAIGDVVYRAVRAGADDWMTETGGRAYPLG